MMGKGTGLPDYVFILRAVGLERGSCNQKYDKCSHNDPPFHRTSVPWRT